MKHSQCTTITIRLRQLENTLELTYVDNGIGFDKAEAAKSPGIGIMNVRDRVNVLKGTYDLDTEPGKGIHYFITLPLWFNTTEDTNTTTP